MELSQRLDLGALDLADDTDAAEARDTFTRLAELVEEVASVEIAPETGLGESGVSSLDRIEDAFGVPIDEHVYASCPTAQDLAKYVEEHQ